MEGPYMVTAERRGRSDSWVPVHDRKTTSRGGKRPQPRTAQAGIDPGISSWNYNKAAYEKQTIELFYLAKQIDRVVPQSWHGERLVLLRGVIAVYGTYGELRTVSWCVESSSL